MILLGILLLAATGAFIGLLIAYNTAGPDYTVGMFGNSIATMNSLAIFVSGLILTAILGVGLMLLFSGLRWRRHKATVAGARKERDRLLAERMRAERTAPGTTAQGTTSSVDYAPDQTSDDAAHGAGTGGGRRGAHAADNKPWSG